MRAQSKSRSSPAKRLPRRSSAEQLASRLRFSKKQTCKPLPSQWRLHPSNRAVAQLGSALEWGSRGRWFESSRPDFRFLDEDSRSLSCCLLQAGSLHLQPQFHVVQTNACSVLNAAMRAAREKLEIQTAIDEVRAINSELANIPVQRSCVQRTECCQFKLTGRTPYLTRGEALVAARALRATGRKFANLLQATENGSCPMLDRSGHCMIYESRPFGCRTHFCKAAGGDYSRLDVVHLIRRLEALDARLGGVGAQSIIVALEEQSC